MTLTRDDILNLNDLKTEVVMVKEWGGEVIVRMMTGAERSAFEDKVATTSGDINYVNFLEKLVVATVVDGNGNLMFTDADIPALANKSASAILTIAKVAKRINGLSAQDVEVLAKN
jgi:hypothetical protein